mmetsp:Transcript_11618/g.11647  ORF Transcript_11618/g.11647 Transcript_11618/m.11647 type:complete len:226 (-) Transcript_11618:420-1097(-)|eukprot:CAMPEP_0182428670 /NCGR_PEP_ID=MMETSP1167-20130531/23191_1 /TAXON_ID=2988 /ORGANISM="Mallomonas Sp, Strain CCMP3275" /LENGTH=225 /DNA_ID=CAMNT_0024611681 /DNA_START=123 /DNA_END=803 /DNA_ORIENTATION=+
MISSGIDNRMREDLNTIADNNSERSGTDEWTDEEIMRLQEIFIDDYEHDSYEESKPDKQQWRQGKWCKEEMRLCRSLISGFQQGLVWSQKYDGVTLQSFLSKKLRRSPSEIYRRYFNKVDLESYLIRREGLPLEMILECHLQIVDQEAKLLAKESVSKYLRNNKRKRQQNVYIPNIGSHRMESDFQEQLSEMDPVKRNKLEIYQKRIVLDNSFIRSDNVDTDQNE